MYIYRVEDKDGNGCYVNHNPELEDMYIKHSNNDNTPRPLCDRGINRDIYHCEICGFLTKTQALKWFDSDDLILLHELGYKIKKVSVAKITAIGEKQVLAIQYYGQLEEYENKLRTT